MKKKVIKTVISIVIFLSLLAVTIGYLGPMVRPRNSDYDDWQYFYAEDNNTLNVVMTGSSAIYRYWIPAMVYEEQGFTSGMIAQSCQTIHAVPYIMEEALKSQKVDLFVVEARQAVVESVQEEEMNDEQIAKENYYLSMICAGMKPSLTRMHLVHDLLVPTADDKELEWQIPLLKYHENFFDISVSDWLNRLQEGKNPYKGLRVKSLVEKESQDPLTDPADLSDYSALSESVRGALDKIVETAEKHNVQVLFVSTPYFYSQQRYTDQCALNAYMEAKGYPYLNMDTQEIRKQLALDPDTDFYNPRHVNFAGAEKVTHFFAKWLNENYQFSDRLNEKQKKEWEKAVENWDKKEKELTKLWIKNCEKASEAE